MTPRPTTPAPEPFDPPRGPYLTLSFGWSVRTWSVTLTPGSVAALAVMMLVAVAIRAYKPAAPEPPMSAVAVHDPHPAIRAPHGGSHMAPGQPSDETADVITPLNVRDPAALVMAPAVVLEPEAEAREPAEEPRLVPGVLVPR